MSDFAGKIALVTGSASGIGAAVSARLERAGAQVYGADLKPPPTSGPDSRTRAIKLDVRDEADWIATTGTILANHGRLDILANCVGVSAGTPLADTTLAEWRHVLSTNLDGAFLATKYGIRAMRASLLDEQGCPANAGENSRQGMPRCAARDPDQRGESGRRENADVEHDAILSGARARARFRGRGVRRVLG